MKIEQIASLSDLRKLEDEVLVKVADYGKIPATTPLPGAE